MEIIIFITGALLVVSLYDYFTSKNWQQVTSPSRNDVVFDERNKKYGAYQIRKSYDKTIITILIGLITTISMSYGAYLLVKSDPEKEYLTAFDEKQVIIDLPPDEIVEVIHEETIKADPPAKLENQIDLGLFDITDDPSPDTHLNTQDDASDKKIGNQDIKDGGDDGFEDPDETVTKPIVVVASPEIFVDIEAEFPGGYAEMMKYFIKNMKYPEIPLQSGIEGRVSLRFVVEKDGSIGNIDIQRGVPNCPECDKEAIRVIKSMPKWKAGKINGQAVRSYYTMPIVFKIKN